MVDSTVAKKTAFKIGFLTKLAEAGVTPNDLFEKIAARPIGGDDAGRALYDVAKWGGGGIGHAIKQVGGLASGAVSKAPAVIGYGLAGAPVAIGGGLGAIEQLTEAPTSTDLELLRKAELAGLYKQLASEIHNRVANKGVM